MFSRSKSINESFEIRPHDKYHHKMLYIIDNRKQYDIQYLINLLERNHCKYDLKWVSKMDSDVIVYEPPMIYDAYDCAILAFGLLRNLHFSVAEFQMRNDRVEFFHKCLGDVRLPDFMEPLDVSETARKLFKYIENF